ncbi:unnamed protein product [Spirodela intermedia]|uniref:Katanin p80 WD40 repeat-containing subunit B1 homolog n=1 Tax=Spirodela intermedia TaxID=51605 RepID=A0A7I8KC97_SPIIN|nr:unnamed protein product [Spirodela intermedia]
MNSTERVNYHCVRACLFWVGERKRFSCFHGCGLCDFRVSPISHLREFGILYWFLGNSSFGAARRPHRIHGTKLGPPSFSFVAGEKLPACGQHIPVYSPITFTFHLGDLSGHTSSIESVTFDSAEVLVLAGAYSGTIKLWDLEEGKIVRTLTGHRASCASVEFHPFGEFFASGSVDADLKIWDIRRKGCIHTYKGHSRAIKNIKFTPDGRWVVSGGEDNVVKLWDLTAGKLLHEFKAHTGAIQSINFHPHEFLLATGSADRTVKFWDLETFELIGSAGPEMTGVRSTIFHPDGKALFCGLDETLKVFSWEPLRCHDAVDMRWSILGDLSIYEGKLLGCSYHQSSVGVWVADISLISPYTIGVVPRASGVTEPLYNCDESHVFRHDGHFKPKTTLEEKVEDFQEEIKETIKSVYVASSDNDESASLSTGSVETSSINLRNSTASSGKKYVRSAGCDSSSLKFDAKAVSKVSPPKSSLISEIKAGESFSGTPKRTSSGSKLRGGTQRSIGPGVTNSSNTKVSLDSHRGTKAPMMNTRVTMPVVIPRESPNLPNTAIARKDVSNEVDVLGNMSSKSNLMRRSSYDNIGTLIQKKGNGSGLMTAATNGSVAIADSNFHSVRAENEGVADVDEKECFGTRIAAEKFGRILSPEESFHSLDDEGSESVCSSTEKAPAKNIGGVAVRHGRTRSLVESWEKFRESSTSVNKFSSTLPSESNGMASSMSNTAQMTERDLRSDDDGCSNTLLQTHDALINILKSRLTKLQIMEQFLIRSLQMVRHLWTESGVKGAIAAIVKLPDHSVQVDVISTLTEKIELFTLDLFSLLLPLLAGLLSSKTERHIEIALEMLLKLVRVFGTVVRSTGSSSLPVGVDLQAEQRRDRCRLCLTQLETVKQDLPSLIKKGGSIARRSVELNLALQD